MATMYMTVDTATFVYMMGTSSFKGLSGARQRKMIVKVCRDCISAGLVCTPVVMFTEGYSLTGDSRKCKFAFFCSNCYIYIYIYTYIYVYRYIHI